MKTNELILIIQKTKTKPDELKTFLENEGMIVYWGNQNENIFSTYFIDYIVVEINSPLNDLNLLNQICSTQIMKSNLPTVILYSSFFEREDLVDFGFSEKFVFLKKEEGSQLELIKLIRPE